MPRIKPKAKKADPELFIPWFLSRDVLHKVKKLLPHIYQKRLLKYFELYGCIRCQKRNLLYSCNGLCFNCTANIRDKMVRCDRLLAEEYTDALTPPKNELVEKFNSARTLLADLAHHKKFLIGKQAQVAPRSRFIRVSPKH